MLFKDRDRSQEHELNCAALNLFSLSLTLPLQGGQRRCMGMKKGRKTKTVELKREHGVSSRLNSAELLSLDAARGRMRRGEYLRNAAFGQLPAPIPATKLEAWRVLSEVAGNLATVATAMRAGEYKHLDEVKHVLDDLRLRNSKKPVASEFSFAT